MMATAWSKKFLEILSLHWYQRGCTWSSTNRRHIVTTNSRGRAGDQGYQNGDNSRGRAGCQGYQNGDNSRGRAGDQGYQNGDNSRGRAGDQGYNNSEYSSGTAGDQGYKIGGMQLSTARITEIDVKLKSYIHHEGDNQAQCFIKRSQELSAYRTLTSIERKLVSVQQDSNVEDKLEENPSLTDTFQEASNRGKQMDTKRRNQLLSSPKLTVSDKLDTDFVKHLNDGLLHDLMKKHDCYFYENELVIVRVETSRGVWFSRLVCLEGNEVSVKPAHGTMCVSVIVGASPGVQLRTSKGYLVLCMKLTLPDYIHHMKKASWVPNPKMLSTLLSRISLSDGAQVLEVGTGSGAATLLLSFKVWQRGHIDTVEKTSTSHKVSQANVRRWMKNHNLRQAQRETGSMWPDNVSFHNASITDIRAGRLLSTKLYDLVYLDVCDPISAMVDLIDKVIPGGIIAVYSPSISHLVSSVHVIGQRSLPLLLEATYEETHSEQSIGKKVQKYSTDTGQNTAFCGVFRRVLPNTGQPVRAREHFSSGDMIVLRPTVQRKGYYPIMWIETLTESGHCDPTRIGGQLSHDQIIKAGPGQLLRMHTKSTNTKNAHRLLYAVKADVHTIAEYAYHKGYFHVPPRHVSVMSHMASIYPSDDVFILQDSGNILPGLISHEVTDGRVHSVCIKRKSGKLKERAVIEGWMTRLANWTVSDTSNWNPKMAIYFNKVLAFGREAVPLLLRMSDYMKPGTVVVFYTNNVSDVQLLVQQLSEEGGSLHPVSLFKDKEKQWLIQTTKTGWNGTEEFLGYKPVICRPRYHMKAPEGYFIKLEK